MKRFDSMTLLGIALGLGLVLLGIRLEGDLGAFWNLSGILITLGGSFGLSLIHICPWMITVSRKAITGDCGWMKTALQRSSARRRTREWQGLWSCIMTGLLITGPRRCWVSWKRPV